MRGCRSKIVVESEHSRNDHKTAETNCNGPASVTADIDHGVVRAGYV